MAKISILEALRLALAANKEYIDSKYYDIDAIDELLNGKADVDHEIHLVLGEESTNAFYGDKGKVAYDHSQADHAPIDAQKNSDITKEEIEAKLTGEITSHTHNQYITSLNVTISDCKVVLKNGNGETLSEANLEIANSDDIDAILASLDEDKEEN
jgi:hypothetical protein